VARPSGASTARSMSAGTSGGSTSPQGIRSVPTRCAPVGQLEHNGAAVVH
jgi:hypothetical protein